MSEPNIASRVLSSSRASLMPDIDSFLLFGVADENIPLNPSRDISITLEDLDSLVLVL